MGSSIVSLINPRNQPMPKAYIRARRSAQEPTAGACFLPTHVWGSQVGRKKRGTSPGSSVLNSDKMKAPAVWRPAKPVFFTSTIPIILGLAWRMTPELVTVSTFTRNFLAFKGSLAIKIYQDTSQFGISNIKKILLAKNFVTVSNRYWSYSTTDRSALKSAFPMHCVYVLFSTGKQIQNRKDEDVFWQGHRTFNNSFPKTSSTNSFHFGFIMSRIAGAP